MRVWGKFLPVVAAAFFIAGDAAPVTAQATGTITGSVVDATTGQTLESAQVFISALNTGGLSNQQGRFLLLNVPTGQHELEVELIGYTTVTQTVTVTANQTATITVEMNSTALMLQELVVTGVAGKTPRVKLPFTVEKVDFKDMPVPTSSVGTLLAGKLPGVRVVKGSGQPGQGGSILLRGPTTITGSQSPLIIIDGVITDNRLSDIDALDVESIEVVKGAAAASLYGSRAQNGVIQITTKRGAGLRTDQSRVTFRSEFGSQELGRKIGLAQNHFYKMIGGFYVDSNDQPLQARNGSICQDPRPECGWGPGMATNGANTAVTFQDGEFIGPTFDHIDLFFDPGNFLNEFVAVEGKTGSTNYRASFSYTKEDGVIQDHDGFTRRNFRLNIDHTVNDQLDVSINTFFASTRQEDITGTGFFGLTFLGANIDLLALDTDGELKAQPDPLSLEDNPIYGLQQQKNEDDRTRFMGSVFARWSPLSWFELEANYSIDRADFKEFALTPKGFKRQDQDPSLGTISRTNQIDTDINSSLTAAVNKTFGDLTTRTRFRFLLEDQHRERFRAFGRDFAVGDVPTLDNVTGDKTITSDQIDIVSKGFFGIVALDYQGKYIGDVLFRRDGSSLFGPDERWHNYARGSFAYRMAQESWWPFDFIDEFKVRYSIGQAGGRPRFAAQFETFDVSEGVISPLTLGNKALKPELTTEQEFGFEFVLWNKIAGGLTYADSETEDQLLRVPLAGFAGFSSQWQNAGTLESNTYEAYIEAAVIQTPDLGWTTRFNFDRTRQKITRLDVPPFRTGSFFWVREGEALGAMFGARFVTKCSDLAVGSDCSQFATNQDGYLVPVGAGNTVGDGIAKNLWGTEVATGAGDERWGIPLNTQEADGNEFVRMGNTTSDFAVSWSNTIRWKQLSLYSLFDSEQGFDIYNRTAQWSYRELKSDDCDQGGKSDALKLPVLYCAILYNVNSPSSHFVEDGSYVKLRELSLRYTFNADQLNGIAGLSQLSINLIGRNLYTWTDYRGYDPEVGQGSFGSAVLGRADNFSFPNFRTFTAALELVF